MKADDKVSAHQLTVQLDQVLIVGFVPVLSRAPRVPELLLFGGEVEGEVLVDGAPCAV